MGWPEHLGDHQARRIVRWLLAPIGLLLVGCASMETPYDAPQVGRDDIEAVLSIERYDDLGEGSRIVEEIVVYRVRRTDGLECDVVFAKEQRSGGPDNWFALQRQRPRVFGGGSALYHIIIPICLRVEAIP